MMQYYLGIADPGALPEEVWAQKFAQLNDIRQREAKQKQFEL